jgi:hypothetical protein
MYYWSEKAHIRHYKANFDFDGVDQCHEGGWQIANS